MACAIGPRFGTLALRDFSLGRFAALHLDMWQGLRYPVRAIEWRPVLGRPELDQIRRCMLLAAVPQGSFLILR